MGALSLCRLIYPRPVCQSVDCDSGLLELNGIGGCSVGNLFVACLSRLR